VQQPFDGYDVVSDVDHPHALERLLHRLDYRFDHGSWTHPDGRIPVILGGAVDRHGATRSCAPMLQELVDSGSALMTLGPEELAALERHVSRRRQRVLVHAGAVADSPEHEVPDTDDAGLGEWFRSVPLWLDLPGLRVVHGCWSDGDVELLRDALDGNCLVDDEHFESVISSPRHRRAVRTLLSGATIELPEHLWCRGARGEIVRSARFRWWSHGSMTLRERAMLPPGCTTLDGRFPAVLDDTPVRPGAPALAPGGTPVVISRCVGVAGPLLLSPSVLCLGEVGRGVAGPIAYRWSGETGLDATNLVRLD
jgi:hypothetical protein